MRKKNTCTHAAVSASGSLMHHSLCVCFHLRLKQQTAIFERKLGLTAKQVAPEKSRCVLIYHKSQMDFLDRRIHSQICLFWFFPLDPKQHSMYRFDTEACVHQLSSQASHHSSLISDYLEFFSFFFLNCRTPTCARAHTLQSERIACQREQTLSQMCRQKSNSAQRY